MRCDGAMIHRSAADIVANVSQNEVIERFLPGYAGPGRVHLEGCSTKEADKNSKVIPDDIAHTKVAHGKNTFAPNRSAPLGTNKHIS